MRSVGISRFTLSLFAAVIISFSMLFVVLNRAGHAEYACETYSAGNYGAGSNNTGDACPTDTGNTSGSTGIGSTGTGTSTSSSNTGSSSSSSTTGNASSGSSTSTGTGDNSTPVDGSKSVTLNDYPLYQNGSGQILIVTAGQKAYFTVGSEAHTVTVKEITADYVIFTVASTPTDVKVPYGQTVNYDVNKDGTNDIALTYKSLASDGVTATVSFAAIPTTDSNATAPSSIQSTTPTEKNVSATYWWILIPAIVIVALAAFFIIRKKRAPKAGNFTPTSSSEPPVTPPSNDSSQFHN